MANKNRASEKESFWRLALEEFQGSGLSVRAFCRREGLSEASFFAWRRTLQERDAAKPEAGRDQAELIPVDVVEPVDSSPGCEQAPAYLEVITPSGFTLRFHSDIEPRQLDDLLPDRWLKANPAHVWTIDEIRREERKRRKS